MMGGWETFGLIVFGGACAIAGQWVAAWCLTRPRDWATGKRIWFRDKRTLKDGPP